MVSAGVTPGLECVSLLVHCVHVNWLVYHLFSLIGTLLKLLTATSYYQKPLTFCVCHGLVCEIAILCLNFWQYTIICVGTHGVLMIAWSHSIIQHQWRIWGAGGIGRCPLTGIGNFEAFFAGILTLKQCSSMNKNTSFSLKNWKVLWRGMTPSPDPFPSGRGCPRGPRVGPPLQNPRYATVQHY